MEKLELIIDSEPQPNNPNVFLIHPCRIQNLHVCRNGVFDSAKILNTPAEFLTAPNILTILLKLKPKAPIEIIIDQPLQVLQNSDAGQILANAELAGVDLTTTDVQRLPTCRYNKEGFRIDSKKITGVKPERKNVAMEETVVETTTKKKK